MQEEHKAVLHCLLCAWEGVAAEASHKGYTKTNKKWYLCEWHANMKSIALTGITVITQFDMNEAYSTRVREVTTKWIQHQQKSAR